MKLNFALHPTTMMELEALFKCKHTLESVPLNMYVCATDCAQNIFHLIPILILWVHVFSLLRVRMPRVMCHRSASFQFGEISLKYKLCHYPA